MFDITFYDLNLFGVFLLLTLLLVIYSKHEKYTLRGRLFRILIILTIFMLVMEIFSWLFEGLPGDWNRLLNLLSNTIFTGFSVVVVSIWAIYIDHMIFDDAKQTLRKVKWYLIPAIVMILLSIVNIFIPFLFEVSADNVYARLGGIWIAPSLTYLIYGYVVYTVYTHRRRLTSNFIIGVTLFLILPQLAVVGQLLSYGLMLIWVTTALAIVFSYLLFETTSSSTDYLTGVYTRIRAEDYMSSLLRKRKPFSLILIDMDDFKQLDDTFGHHAGDKALIEMGRILQEVFTKNAIVARFGGDEFIVVIETTNRGTVEMYRKSIYQKLRLSLNDYISQSRFSLGVAYCTSAECSVEQMMIEADNNMYLDKAKNKNFKRRKDDR